MVLAVGGVSLVAGWPGREWFAYTLGELPRYHRDAVGLPFPWPVHGWPLPAAARPGVALAWLVFVLLLLVQAVRTTIVRRDSAPAVQARVHQLLFLAVFAVYWSLRENRTRKIWLLLCSYFFYACWNWKFLFLIMASSALDYWADADIPCTSPRPAKSLAAE